jgi:hypothetical protein
MKSTQRRIRGELSSVPRCYQIQVEIEEQYGTYCSSSGFDMVAVVCAAGNITA